MPTGTEQDPEGQQNIIEHGKTLLSDHPVASIQYTNIHMVI